MKENQNNEDITYQNKLKVEKGLNTGAKIFHLLFIGILTITTFTTLFFTIRCQTVTDFCSYSNVQIVLSLTIISVIVLIGTVLSYIGKYLHPKYYFITIGILIAISAIIALIIQ